VPSTKRLIQPSRESYRENHIKRGVFTQGRSFARDPAHAGCLGYDRKSLKPDMIQPTTTLCESASSLASVTKEQPLG
jgi:hypothetical protein